VKPAMIVESEPLGDSAFESNEVLVLAEIDILVLEASPTPQASNLTHQLI